MSKFTRSRYSSLRRRTGMTSSWGTLLTGVWVVRHKIIYFIWFQGSLCNQFSLFVIALISPPTIVYFMLSFTVTFDPGQDFRFNPGCLLSNFDIAKSRTPGIWDQLLGRRLWAQDGTHISGSRASLVVCVPLHCQLYTFNHMIVQNRARPR